MDRYDLCVIGGGPAGIAGAIRAADLGKRVALIEAGPLGGAFAPEGRSPMQTRTFDALVTVAQRTDRWLAERAPMT